MQARVAPIDSEQFNVQFERELPRASGRGAGFDDMSLAGAGREDGT